MTVTMKFYHCWSNNGEIAYGHAPTLVRAININNLPRGTDHPFYTLGSAIYELDRISFCDIVLKKIAQIEAGEIEEYMWEGQGFLHYIKPDSVLFEHAIFGECPEWPLWSCSLAQYKAALQGWRQFIDMPESIDSELIIELPDDGSSHFPQS